MRPCVERLEDRRLLTRYGGVEFPQGASSFADEVLFYRPVGSIAPAFKHPAEALGIPNYPASRPSEGEVTLGQGGELGLSFTDNLLTNSATAESDLWIFEVGPAVEASFISIRPTAATQARLNATLDADGFAFVSRIQGATRGVDIDAVFTGYLAGDLEFDAVKIVDDPNANDGTGSSPGADIDAVGAIASSTVAPLISITAPDAAAAEQGINPGTFTLRRLGPVDQAVQVNLRYAGTAGNGIDYVAMPTVVTIPAYTSRLSLVLEPVDDALPEPAETVRVTIVSAGVLPIDANAQYAVARIADNDTPIVALTTLDNSAAETVVGAPTSGVLLLQRNGLQIGSPLTMTLQIAGSATYGVDYTVSVVGGIWSYDSATNRLSITLAANARNASIYIKALNDRIDENLENVVLTLLADPNYLVNSTKKTGTVHITDNPLTGR